MNLVQLAIRVEPEDNTQAVFATRIRHAIEPAVRALNEMRGKPYGLAFVFETRQGENCFGRIDLKHGAGPSCAAGSSDAVEKVPTFRETAHRRRPVVAGEGVYRCERAGDGVSRKIVPIPLSPPVAVSP